VRANRKMDEACLCSATGGVKKGMLDTVTGRGFLVALKRESCKTVESKGSKSLFLHVFFHFFRV
jgi:hypothetical protein